MSKNFDTYKNHHNDRFYVLSLKKDNCKRMRIDKWLLKYFFVFISLFCFHTSFSGVAFFHYGIENGLPETRIVGISQDSVGFIWLAGENAVFRFDGTQFKPYRNTENNTSILPVSKISTIFTDSKGTIWIGSENGIVSYHFSHDQFSSPMAGWDHVYVDDICEDNTGQLWIATDEGLACFNPANNQTTWYTGPDHVKDGQNTVLPTSHIQNVACQPDGKIWAAQTSGELFRLDPTTGKVENFGLIGDIDINTLSISKLQFKNGQLFISTYSNGFFWLNPEQKTIKSENFGHSGYTIHHFRLSEDSIAWLGSNNGLIRFNYQTGHFRFFNNDPTDPLSLNRSSVEHVFIDNEDNLWVSLGIRGINYGLTQTPFYHFGFSEKWAYQLTQKEVTSICFDHVGNMWLGYEGGIVEKHSYAPLGKKQYPLSSQSRSGAPGSIMAIYEDSKHRVWIGGWESGIQKLNDNGTAFENVAIVPDSIAQRVAAADIRGITEDGKGNLWISFHGIGLGKYNPDNHQMRLFRFNPDHPLTSLSNDFVYNLCTDQKNNLWIASAYGISKLNLENEQITTYFQEPENLNSLSNNAINTIYCDAEGLVWAGTSDGLNVYLPEKNAFQPVLTDRDVPFLNISDIRSVNPGEIWASAQSGIFRIIYTLKPGADTLQFESRFFNRSSGLLSSNYFARSSAVNGEGNIFFGGNEGIDFFNPEEVAAVRNQKPKLLLTDFMVDGQPVYPARTDNGNNVARLVLDHHNRSISIRFTTLRFNSGELQKFRYKLEGFDDRWFFPQDEQVATFTHLPPGKYIFLVEANENNKWEGLSASVSIKVKPPFWKTLPFMVSVSILFIVLVYLAVWARSRVLLLRQKELERIIDERTRELIQKNEELEKTNQTKNKLFSIISHDLKSPFSGLLGILEVLTEHNNGLEEQKQKELLLTAKNSANNTFELLETLLTWARSQMKETTSRPKNHNLATLLEKNIELKQPSALQKEISIEKEFSGKLMAYFDENMINTVIRNILNNAVKFTRPGGKIKISAWEQIEDVTVCIADTGIGLTDDEKKQLFDIGKTSRRGTQGEKGTGLGMVICKEFVEKCHGKIWAAPNQPKGTAFYFTVPVSSASEIFENKEEK